jgi:hypothetical protein
VNLFLKISYLLRLRLKIILNTLQLFSLRSFSLIIGSGFALFFIFSTLFILLLVNRNLYYIACVSLPILLHTSFAGQTSSQVSEGKAFVFSPFLKVTPVTNFEKAVFLFFHEIIFSPKLWSGIFLLNLLGLFFFKGNILIIFVANIIFSISFLLVSTVFDLVTYVSIHQNKTLRLLGGVANTIFSVLPLLLFFSLFSLLSDNPKNSFLIQFFDKTHITLGNPNVSFILLVIFTLFLSVAIYSFLQIMAVNHLYFFEAQPSGKKQSKKTHKPSPKILTDFLDGVFIKDIKWILKFPNIFLNFIYPLLFVVLASKFFLSGMPSFQNNFFRTFYLIIGMGNLSFLLDNQVSIYSEYFKFDLNHTIRIRDYFLSKLIISIVILTVTFSIFFILNSSLKTGYNLSFNSFLAFLFYILILNSKGILLSLYDYRPFSYSQRQLRSTRPGCVNALALTFVNFITWIPLFALLSLNTTIVITAILILGSLISYCITLLFSEKLFIREYFKFTGK